MNGTVVGMVTLESVMAEIVGPVDGASAEVVEVQGAWVKRVKRIRLTLSNRSA